jgi:L,D-transpeptidase ErfK/SrfK
MPEGSAALAMATPALGPRRRASGLAVIAVLAACGLSACGITGPSPRPQADPGSSPRPGGEAAPNAEDPTHLVLRLGERRLYVMDGTPSALAESFPIAIGKEGWETPVGRYQVEEMVEHPDFAKLDGGVVVKWFPPGPTNPLGERWIGFAHGEGWTLGIHGTPHPELLGRAVSHGCIRMRNADVIRVYDRVRLGTPVIVEP